MTGLRATLPSNSFPPRVNWTGRSHFLEDQANKTLQQTQAMAVPKSPNSFHSAKHLKHGIIGTSWGRRARTMRSLLTIQPWSTLRGLTVWSNGTAQDAKKLSRNWATTLSTWLSQICTLSMIHTTWRLALTTSHDDSPWWLNDFSHCNTLMYRHDH